jgi:HlyD family secretion protein
MSLRPTVAITLLTLALAAVGCTAGEPGADAFGNFEATEVRVSAEVGGRLLEFPVEAGQTLAAGATVARGETAALELEQAQLAARHQATLSRRQAVDAQIATLQEQQRLAVAELARTEALVADQAATPQQLDRVRSEAAVLEQRIREARAQYPTIADEAAVVDAQMASLEDRIARAAVVNPVAGTVLTVYAEPGELVAPGQRLYDIADLSALELRAYVSGGQLAQLTLGQSVEVAIDQDGDSLRFLPGEIVWIASEAEFTPSTLQTREERVDRVYAFKVRVANPDGVLKIGMPGEVYLRRDGGS